MNYKVNLDALDKSFRVPNSLTDSLIKLANPKHIIILLWVLRYAQTPKSSEQISEELHIDKAIVNDAIFYWIDHGLIIPDGMAPTTTAKKDVPKAVKKPEEKAEKVVPKVKVEEEKPAPKKLGSSMANEAEILKRAEESDEFAFLLHKSQEIYGRTISLAERSMMLSLMDYYGLPAEVIIMLIGYAVKSGRTGTNYIHTVGISWAENGICTLESAEEKIKALCKTNKLWTKFAAEVGISHRRPTTKQTDLFNKWTSEWKFSIEIIAYAYEKMVESIDKVNYKYLDKMLAGWHENGADTIEKIEALQEKRSSTKKTKKSENKPTSFSTNSFNDFIENQDLNYEKEKK